MHRQFEQEKAAAKKQKKSASIKRKWTDDTAVTNSSPEKIGPPESKQIKMDEFVLPKPLSKIEQQKIDGLVMEYVVTEARPLSTVTKSSFRKLITGLNSRARIMGHKRLRRLISQAYRAFHRHLIKEFDLVEYVCLTVDLWTANHKCFMGTTAHWLDKKTLKRKSAAISCRRIMGKKLLNYILR